MAQDVAPGALEPVRVFLNTWRVPTSTRVPRDLLDAWVADPQAWTRELAALPRPQRADLPALRDLRADLRAALGVRHPVGLAGALDSHPLRAELCPEGADRPVAWMPVGDATADHLVARVVTAVAEGHWHRLKACPDCVHVLHDVSRNASRTVRHDPDHSEHPRMRCGRQDPGAPGAGTQHPGGRPGTMTRRRARARAWRGDADSVPEPALSLD